jgi:hypothetical protein
LGYRTADTLLGTLVKVKIRNRALPRKKRAKGAR